MLDEMTPSEICFKICRHIFEKYEGFVFVYYFAVVFIYSKNKAKFEALYT